MATNSYQIEYAKTGRAGCKDKDCKKSGNSKIDSGDLRIGKNSPNPFSDGDMKLDWYHPACWFSTQSRMKAGSKKIESTDDLEGYDKLKADDKQTIKDLIAGKGVGGGGGGKKKATKAAGKKRKGGSDDDDEGSDDEDKKKKTKKKPAAKKKKGSDDDDDEVSDEEKPKKKKAKAEPKKKAKKGSDDDDEGSDDDKPKKKAKSGGGGGGGKTQRYEMDEKFWEVSVDGDDLNIRFGKIGSNGQSQTKSFANPAAAKKEMDKLIRQKTGKGYELQD